MKYKANIIFFYLLFNDNVNSFQTHDAQIFGHDVSDLKIPNPKIKAFLISDHSFSTLLCIETGR